MVLIDFWLTCPLKVQNFFMQYRNCIPNRCRFYWNLGAKKPLYGYREFLRELFTVKISGAVELLIDQFQALALTIITAQCKVLRVNSRYMTAKMTCNRVVHEYKMCQKTGNKNPVETKGPKVYFLTERQFRSDIVY
jgi:hypothetical protein